MQVKNYIEKYNISQTDFANKIGISKTHVNLIIKGKRIPSVNLAKKIELLTKGKIRASEILGLEE
jgi:DNA-binding XRE family transcriptional regulator